MLAKEANPFASLVNLMSRSGQVSSRLSPLLQRAGALPVALGRASAAVGSRVPEAIGRASATLGGTVRNSLAATAATAREAAPAIGNYASALAGLDRGITPGTIARAPLALAGTPFWDPLIRSKLPRTAAALRWGYRGAAYGPMVAGTALGLYNGPANVARNMAGELGMPVEGQDAVASRARANTWRLLSGAMFGDDPAARISRQISSTVGVAEARDRLHHYLRSPASNRIDRLLSMASLGGWLRRAGIEAIAKPAAPGETDLLPAIGAAMRQHIRTPADAAAFVRSPVTQAYNDILLGSPAVRHPLVQGLSSNALRLPMSPTRDPAGQNWHGAFPQWSRHPSNWVQPYIYQYPDSTATDVGLWSTPRTNRLVDPALNWIHRLIASQGVAK
jgi:hypothetical protein